MAAALDVKALVVVDSDLRSIVPEWIELLSGPILKGGYDYVAPLYSRYKYDGTITNTVTYPLTRALYGHRIRQPIGGDFGVSGDLVRHYLTLDDWDEDISKFGIDIWMTTSRPDRRVRRLPGAAGLEGPRPEGPRLRPRADVPPGRRDDPPAGRPERRPLAADPRLARRAGLRLRAPGRPAAARGQHDPPPDRVPRRLAGDGRDLGRDAHPVDPGHGPGAGRARPASWPRRPSGPARPTPGRRCRPSGWPTRWPRSTSPTTRGPGSSTT